MVDVVGAEAGAHQLLEQIGLLVGALGRAEAGERLCRRARRGSSAGRRRRAPAPPPSSPRGNASRDWPDRPRRRVLRHAVLADQRLGQPVRMVDVVEAEAALDAEPVLGWPGRRGRRHRRCGRP